MLQVSEELLKVIRSLLELIPINQALLESVNLKQIEKWLLQDKIEGLFTIESKEFSEPYADLIPVLSDEISHSVKLRVERFSYFFRVIFRAQPQYSFNIIHDCASSLSTMNNFSFVVLAAYAAEQDALLQGPATLVQASLQFYDISENTNSNSLISRVSSFQTLLNKLAEENPDESRVNELRASLQHNVIAILSNAIHSRSFQEAPALKTNILQIIKLVEEQFSSFREQVFRSLLDTSVEVFTAFTVLFEDACLLLVQFQCLLACAQNPPKEGAPLNPILQPFYKLFKRNTSHRSRPLFELCWQNAFHLIELIPAAQRKEKAWKQLLDSIFTPPLNQLLIRQFFQQSLAILPNRLCPPSYTSFLQTSALTLGSSLLPIINELVPVDCKLHILILICLGSFFTSHMSEQLVSFLSWFSDHSSIINELASLLQSPLIQIQKKNNILQNLAQVYEQQRHFLVLSLQPLGVPMLKLLNSECQPAAKQLLSTITRLSPVLERNPFERILCYDPTQPQYSPRFKINCELRKYQRAGVQYIRQLSHFNLNCALCDEMGLGKTLQALCVVTQYLLDAQDSNILVICPASLIFVWHQQIKKFGFQAHFQVFTDLSPFKVAKCPHRLLILSYKASALHAERVQVSVSNFEWDYLILDEAHFVRNPTTQAYRNIRLIPARHKLALSGTPLQNRVTDLWALFDILNPGIIEDNAKSFRSKFERPLKGNLKSLAQNKNLAKKQSFIKALQELQNRVAPFILRRIKEDVLAELPPRMIEDYFCKPSESQIEAILRIEERGVLSLEEMAKHKLGEGMSEKKRVNVLKSLMMHRKLASHPFLVDHEPDLSSGKLDGLVSLLESLEIIREPEEEEKRDSGFIEASAHKALIFFQFQQFLALVAKEVCEYYSIKYLALKSSLSPAQRAEVAEQFNKRADVRVLLAMTGVGGTGFTLTGADTVIFAEHDWNPANDMQAMDRAHRIGQTRPVNVYRLIVEGSIQEKVMQLQEFKQHLASNLVIAANKEGQDNSKRLTSLFKR